MPTAPQLADIARKAAAEAGFELAGVAPVGPAAELDFFPGWIASGYGGEMQYLRSTDEQGRLKRAALQRVAPWARSLVVCALNYNSAGPQSHEGDDPGRGWISRYAWGGAERPADYHDAVMSRLRQVEARLREFAGGGVQTRCYVDTGPLIERVFAKYAGVGWIGKNTCILNQHIGSWLFLGVILTSLELQPDLPAADRCGTCTRCLDACPTDAFVGPYQLDASKCISYLTIEKRGGIPEDLRAGMGRHVFGCDICQEVCPWNRRAPVTSLPEFQPRLEFVDPSLEWLAAMDDEQFRAAFRGSPLKRAKRAGLRRNAIVAMGNSGDPRFVPLLERLSADPDPNLAEHARWSLARLRTATSDVNCAVPQAEPEVDPR